MTGNPPKMSRYKTTWPEIRQRADWGLFWHNEQGPFHYRENDKGWLKVGLCPFHDDSRTGNFAVNVYTGSFHCHACGAGGNSVEYVKRKYGFGVADAITHIEENT